MPVAFSDFELDNVSIELRYDPAYMLWDRAGKTWTDISRVFERLTVHHAPQPNQTSFEADDRYQLHLNIDRAYVIDYQSPKNIDEDSDKKEKFFSLVTDNLNIGSYSRIGTRLAYHLNFENLDEANSVLLDSNLVRTPKEKLLGVEAVGVKPHYQLLVEDDDLGYSVRMSAQNKIMRFDLPLDAKNIENKEHQVSYLLLDVDLFTRKPVEVSSFNLKGWLEKVRRSTHRDLDKILGLGTA